MSSTTQRERKERGREGEKEREGKGSRGGEGGEEERKDEEEKEGGEEREEREERQAATRLGFSELAHVDESPAGITLRAFEMHFSQDGDNFFPMGKAGGKTSAVTWRDESVSQFPD